MASTIKTVTSGDWSVSTTSSSRVDYIELHTFKIRGSKIQRGEGYGRRFATNDDAWRWALEHGYLQPYVTPWCRHCRQLHTFLGRKSGFCHALKASTHAAGTYDPKTGGVR